VSRPPRAIVFGISLTSEVLKMPESVYVRLLPVWIFSNMALNIAAFGVANLAHAAEINFAAGDLCLRNPNAIAPPATARIYRNLIR
jgi:hypothetical protein